MVETAKKQRIYPHPAGRQPQLPGRRQPKHREGVLGRSAHFVPIHAGERFSVHTLQYGDQMLLALVKGQAARQQIGQVSAGRRAVPVKLGHGVRQLAQLGVQRQYGLDGGECPRRFDLCHTARQTFQRLTQSLRLGGS